MRNANEAGKNWVLKSSHRWTKGHFELSSIWLADTFVLLAQRGWRWRNAPTYEGWARSEKLYHFLTGCWRRVLLFLHLKNYLGPVIWLVIGQNYSNSIKFKGFCFWVKSKNTTAKGSWSPLALCSVPRYLWPSSQWVNSPHLGSLSTHQ